MPSLFDPLVAQELTSLYVRHDWRTKRSFAIAAREWDANQSFADYGRCFDCETRLTTSPVQLDAAATRALFERTGSLSALERLFELVAAGRHQGVDIWHHAGKDIRFISNMHSNVLGLANRRHALRAGGIRRHDRSDVEEQVLIDGLNLARAMTFKNAAAQIPYGGSKICVICEPVVLDDYEALGFLAWCIDRSRSFTGPDMGFVPEHADVLRERYTRNIVGGPGGSLGPTGAPTAEGLRVALDVAVRHHLGRDGLAGLSVAVQGLGAVGAPFARHLLTAGVGRLLVADTDPNRVEAFIGQLDEAALRRVEVVSPPSLLHSEVDIVSPNAVGGILGREEIEQLRCRMVMGGANNQLRAVSQEQELALAEALASRDIFYQVDWMHNAAGVIAGCEEWERQERASMDRVVTHLVRVCRDGVLENLERARRAGLTPTAAAYRHIESQVYPA